MCTFPCSLPFVLNAAHKKYESMFSFAPINYFSELFVFPYINDKGARCEVIRVITCGILNFPLAICNI